MANLNQQAIDTFFKATENKRMARQWWARYGRLKVSDPQLAQCKREIWAMITPGPMEGANHEPLV